MNALNTIEAMEQLHELVSLIEENPISDELTPSQILDAAIKIQENMIKSEYNELYAAANVVSTGSAVPSALEKIAMILENNQ